MFELPAHGAVFREVAARFCKRMAYIGDRAVFVFGVAFEHDGGAARPIAFVSQLFVCRSLDFAGATLDRTLDIVRRNRSVSRLLDRQSQPWVCPRIASARA